MCDEKEVSEAMTAYDLGMELYAKGNYKEALKYLSKAARIFKKFRTPLGSYKYKYFLANIIRHVGNICRILGKADESMHYYVESHIVEVS
ncbi:MAG: tetratricopeptide repeat protein [Candidatus Odinarchaeia archaeon]